MSFKNLNEIGITVFSKIKVVKPSKENFFFYGTGFDEKKYILIKINFLENAIEGNIKNYLLNLENSSHINTLKYYGLYYDSKESSYYLSFECPTCSFNKFLESNFKFLTIKQKFILTSQILELSKYFNDRKENNPLMKNWKFSFVEVNKDMTFTYKYLNIGKVYPMDEGNDSVFELPNITHKYRESLKEQRELLKIWGQSEKKLLNRFYVNNFALILQFIFPECYKNEITNSLYREIALFLKNFINLYADPKKEGFFGEEKDTTLDRACHDFKTFILNNFQFISYINPSQNNLKERKNVKKIIDISESPDNKKEFSNFIKNKRLRDGFSGEEVVDLTMDEQLDGSSCYNLRDKLFIDLIEDENEVKPNEVIVNIVRDTIDNESCSNLSEKSKLDNKLKFMYKHFPVQQMEFHTYFKKPFKGKFKSNVLSEKELPKPIRKNILNKIVNESSNIVSSLDMVKPNYNININMTNYIINSQNPECLDRYCSQSNIIIDNINNNIINSITKNNSSKENNNKRLFSPNKVWSSKILPDSEVRTLLSEAMRIWPYHKVCFIYEDNILIFLSICDYDVFKTLHHIEQTTEFFLEFCKEQDLVKQIKAKNKIKVGK